MQADDFEREHMAIDGAVRFRDRQSSKLGLSMLVLFPGLVGAMIALSLDTSIVVFMSVVGAIAVLLDLALSSYRVVLTGSTLHVQHGLRVERIPLAKVVRVEVAEHRLGRSMVGRGPYQQSLDGRVRRYRKEWQRQLVAVEWRMAGRLRTTLIGTDRAEELAAALERARRVAPEIRVEVPAEADVEAEALAEVEAFLRPEPEARVAR